MEHLKHDAVTSNKLRYTLFNWILDFVTFFSKNKFNLFMRGTDFVDVFVLLSPFFPIFPSDLILYHSTPDKPQSNMAFKVALTNNVVRNLRQI